MAVRLQALRFLLGGAAVVFFSLAQVCSAQYPDDAEIRRIQKLTPAEIEKRIAEINAEIEHLESSLQASAVWKERIELEKRIREMKDETDVKLQPLRDRLDQLERAPSVVKRDGMIERLRRELRPLEYRHRKLVYDEGIRLCEQRHAALKKRTQAATPELQQLGFDVLSFPRIDGSTSSQPLAVLIACRAFDVPYQWKGSLQKLYRDYIDDESPAGLPFAFPGYRGEPEAELAEFTLEAVAEKGKSQRLAQIINHLIATNASTHEAYLNLIKGTSEMGLLARPPSKDELKAAEDAGVSFEITPCAKDAFVFLVHRGNPIRDLSIDQIKQIYAGEITQWQQLGKFTGRITAYQREEESGSQQLMRSLVMKDAPLKSSTRGPNNRNLIGSLMSSVYLELSDDEEGIAYSIFYYEQYMSGSPRTRLLAVDGVEPSAASISDGSYPLLSPVYVVTRKGIDPNSPTAKLRAWLLSAEGQRVVAESGYVPLAREF